MDQTITLVLRLVHIVAGVFWAGAVFLMVGFIFPSVRDAGPGGGPFMQQIQRRRLPVFMNAAAGLTMLSGLILYGRAVAMTDGAWAQTRSAMAFGIGGLATIIAAIVGGAFVSRSGIRLGKLGENIQTSGRPPSPEQAAEMQALQTRMGKGMRVVAALLLVAVTAMATARYL
jgi:hypothetical protein